MGASAALLLLLLLLVLTAAGPPSQGELPAGGLPGVEVFPSTFPAVAPDGSTCVPLLLHIPYPGSPQGRLLAFSESRISSSDDSGTKAFAYAVSESGGATWSSTEYLDVGAQAITNLGAALWDNATSTVFLAFVQYTCGGPYPNQTSAPPMNGTGCEKTQPAEFVPSPWHTSQLLVMSSNDFGGTWTKPMDITSTVVDKTECFYFNPGPGNGVQLRNGSLVFSGTCLQECTEVRKPFCTKVSAPASTQPGGPWDEYVQTVASVISHDHGRTWARGVNAPWRSESLPHGGYDENNVALLRNGSLLLNSKAGWMSKIKSTHRGQLGVRITAVSDSGGLTWSEPRFRPDLPGATCQVSS